MQYATLSFLCVNLMVRREVCAIISRNLSFCGIPAHPVVLSIAFRRSPKAGRRCSMLFCRAACSPFECSACYHNLFRWIFQAQSILAKLGNKYAVETAPRKIFLAFLFPIDGVYAVSYTNFSAAEHFPSILELCERVSRSNADARAGDVPPPTHTKRRHST